MIKHLRHALFGFALVAVAAVPVLFSGGTSAVAAGSSTIRAQIGRGETGYNVNQDMAGSVTVAAQETPTPTTTVATPTKAPGAPNTGSGVERHDQDAGAWLIAAAAAMAAAAGWLAIFGSRRN